MNMVCSRFGTQCQVVSADPPPEELSFLRGWEGIAPPKDCLGHFDVVLLMDCSSPARVGRSSELIDTRQSKVVVIDHHRTALRNGDLVWVDPEAAATAEMLFDWLKSADIPIDNDVATALYTGIATDTGFFAYPNTGAETLRRAAELVEAGAAPHLVYSRINEQRRPATLRLLARALDNMNITFCGKLAWTQVTQDEFAICRAGADDTEGIVNHLRSLAGVEVAAVFVETPVGQVKVSLRSRDNYDVSRLAEKMGGGGHSRAAGMTMEGPMCRARRLVLDEIGSTLCAEGEGSQCGEH